MAVAQNFDLVGAPFGYFVLPLRNGLGGNTKRLSQAGDSAEVLDNFLEGEHPLSVNALTSYVKCTSSHQRTTVRNLPLVADKKKRELDPRAVKRGMAIRDARKKRGISQQTLADAVGVGSREAVSHWEKGTVDEIERRYRLGLCRELGFEEIELLLDPGEARKEFEMPLSQEAKSIAYRWDDLPDAVRAHLRAQIAVVERLLREQPELAKLLYPQIEPPPPKRTK